MADSENGRYEVRKPHVEMAIMLGVGTFRERCEATTRL